MTQVTQAPAKTRAQIASKTLRRDDWWRQPAINATTPAKNSLAWVFPKRATWIS